MRRFFSRWSALLVKPIFRLLAITRSLWSAGPWRVVTQLGRFTGYLFWGVVHWCAGLNYRLLLQGLPAVSAGVVVVSVVSLSMFTPAHEIEKRYLEQAQNLARAKDFPEALVCYERLAYEQGDRYELLYETARVAEAAGHPERCERIMSQLAPPDRQGYAKAHLWQAVRLMTGPPTPQRRQLAETHLLRAKEGGAEDKATLNGLLGEIKLSKGLLDEAEPLLQIAVKEFPKARLRLAFLYALQGNLERSRAEAKLAANYHSNLAKADLFAHYHRMRWAEAKTFLEDFPQAVAILEEGLTGTGEPAYRGALAQTYATWFDHLGRQGTSTTKERLALLEIGLRYDPKNLALLDRLLTVAGIHQSPQVSTRQAAAAVGLLGGGSPRETVAFLVANQEAEAEAGGKTLRELLARGPTAQLHFALGVYAHQRQQLKEARFHWEQAHKMNPDVPAVANNLAWLLLQTSPDELPKALELIELAIEKAPREINFRDTRGRIHAKMGERKLASGDAAGAEKEFRAAVDDLEAVLPASPNSVELHRALADVYTRLELPRLAAEHERLASDTAAKKKANPR